MAFCIRLPKERWRRLGAINVSLICSCGLILLVFLLASVYSRPGSSITAARILFQGDCTTSNRLDLALHLVINIFSTCVLASSNFFMQVVSSPTRKEVDYAHHSLHSLEIGVSSFKNLGSLSWFKIVTWAGLFLSSVPLHLLMNSAIYATGYEGGSWQLTMATAGFVNQTVDYFVPGASLALPGDSCPSHPDGMDDLACPYTSYQFPDSDYIEISVGLGGYGAASYVDSYWNDSSATVDITKASETSSAWKVLTPSECFAEYRFCKPRQKYRDLVVVVDNVDDGWTRSEVYDFNGSPASNLSQFWDGHMDPNSTNSLWYSAQCSIWRDSSDMRVPKYCDSSQVTQGTGCAGALGEPHGIDWLNTTELHGDWTIPFRPSGLVVPSAFGYDEQFNELTVKHCLAEPNPEYTCKVGLAPQLLLIVIGCVLLKGIICVAILSRFTHHSLVTIGDAISSFISCPDVVTSGLGTMSLADSERLEYRAIVEIPRTGLATGPRARRWKTCSPSFRSVLSRDIWIRTYSVFTVGMTVLSAGLGLMVTSYGSSTLVGTFGSLTTSTIGVNFSYLGALLMANVPQLILSFCYFSFNAFFTRIQAEKEWNSYSMEYKPLRVSNPRGQQISNYRLQLPYKYSIPLMGMSILLHWILSNGIFLTITEGGFWIGRIEDASMTTGFGLSADAYAAVGVSASGSGILALFVISAVLCCLPVLFSFRKVPGDMVSGGTNSLVLSAACHVSTMERGKRAAKRTRTASSAAAAEKAGGSRVGARYLYTDGGDAASSTLEYKSSSDSLALNVRLERSWIDIGPQRTPRTKGPAVALADGERVVGDEEWLLPEFSEDNSEEYERALLEEVATSHIKWGAVAVSSDMLEGLAVDEPVMHLGFGTEEDDVQPPQEGHLYI